MGPLPVDGNNEFLVVYKNKQNFRIFTRFYQQPDSYDVSLIADYEKQCEFSTFLWSGDILLKIRDRYLVFDQTGRFVYQVNFTDIDNNEFGKILSIANNKKSIGSISPYLYSELKKI